MKLNAYLMAVIIFCLIAAIVFLQVSVTTEEEQLFPFDDYETICLSELDYSYYEYVDCDTKLSDLQET